MFLSPSEVPLTTPLNAIDETTHSLNSPQTHKQHTALGVWETFVWPPSPPGCTKHPWGFPGPGRSGPRLSQQRLCFLTAGWCPRAPGLGMCCVQRKALLLTGKRDFFCLTLNNWGRVGYYLIRNGSLHLLRTMGWHRGKNGHFSVCKIIDNVTFASGLSGAFIRSLQLRCHRCV